MTATNTNEQKTYGRFMLRPYSRAMKHHWFHIPLENGFPQLNVKETWAQSEE